MTKTKKQKKMINKVEMYMSKFNSIHLINDKIEGGVICPFTIQFWGWLVGGGEGR